MKIVLPSGIELSALIVAFLVCCLTWMMLILMRGYLKYGEEFHILKWSKEHTNQLIVGIIITIAIATMRALTKEMSALMAVFGVEAGRPGAAITLGLAIAAFLMGFGPKLFKKNGEKTNATNKTSSTGGDKR